MKVVKNCGGKRGKGCQSEVKESTLPVFKKVA